MTPWKDYPHLFAGGAFKANTKYSINHKIVGVLNDDSSLVLKDDVEDEIFYEYADNCTLIARRIEDMTDEECTESVLFDCIKDKAEPKYIRKELVKMNSYKRTMRLSLYLLSIGVYPFDQSHFDLPDNDPAKVIDIKTI